MNILIIERRKHHSSALRMRLQQLEHSVFYMEDQLAALELVARENIDVVIVEVLPPIEQGIDTIKRIRAAPFEKWVHIIMIMGSFVEQEVEAGLEAGADGYIKLPINPIILKAKLNNFARSVSLQQTLIESNRELIQYREQNEMENNLAKEVFNRLVRHELTKDKKVDHWLLPSRIFSGDLIGAKRDNQENLYFFIADATGHGLAAALPTMVVNQVFQALIDKGFSVADVVREINQRLYLEMPVGHFVALAVGKVNFAAKSIELWNGGLPDLLLLNDGGQLLCRFSSRHVFAGVLADRDFSCQTDVFHWNEASELIAYSDGVTDIADVEGRHFGDRQLLDLLFSAPAGKRIEYLKDRLHAYMDEERERDDISCLSIYCE